MSKRNISTTVAEYYTEKFEEFGATPQGVDWNSDTSQLIRFEQLARIFPKTEEFSVLDYGCGYGAFFQFLSKNFSNFRYLGYDFVEASIEQAKLSYQEDSRARFQTSPPVGESFDYSVASGIFGVKGSTPELEWRDYVAHEIDTLASYAKVGFGFNMLTLFSHPERKREALYYADPCEYFTLLKSKYARDVALLHDYELFEFTLLATHHSDPVSKSIRSEDTSLGT